MPKTDKVTIIVRGPGVRPATLSASDLAELIVAAESAVAAIIQQSDPAARPEDLYLGLTGVFESSAGFVMTAPDAERQVPAFALWTDSINRNEFTGLPWATYKGASTLLKVSRRLEAEITLGTSFEGGAVEAVVRPDSEITAPEPVHIRGETVFYGEVIGVGGAEPKVRLRRPDHSLFALSVDKQLARSLAQHLYSWVGLQGEAVWDAETREVVDFRVKDVVSLSRRSLTEALSRVAEVAAPYYNEIGDVAEYFRRLREED